jgi:hypothetical protein
MASAATVPSDSRLQQSQVRRLCLLALLGHTVRRWWTASSRKGTDVDVGSIILITVVICAVIGAVVGQPRGHGGDGFALGLLLGPVGVIIVAVMTPTPQAAAIQQQRVNQAMQSVGAGTRACPWCAEQIQPAALVCRHCNRDVSVLLAPSAGTPASWLVDPSGRYPDRWWGGSDWTRWVRDKPGGTRFEDPPVVTGTPSGSAAPVPPPILTSLSESPPATPSSHAPVLSPPTLIPLPEATPATRSKPPPPAGSSL